MNSKLHRRHTNALLLKEDSMLNAQPTGYQPNRRAISARHLLLRVVDHQDRKSDQDDVQTEDKGVGRNTADQGVHDKRSNYTSMTPSE